MEALDLTADRLRRFQDAFAKVGDDSRVRANRVRAYRHTGQDDDTGAVRPVRSDDQQAHHPQEPGPHRGRQADH
ncbi:hypothetical protein [Streptomyces sp. DH12]|uniref:hypothetical protein n=1 Tax=Streptomyces sp. DH12 TaxID=2857010 RepID=UPI001E37F978|nr:hypothetical protein [Streptomyces sp. DH12]